MNFTVTSPAVRIGPIQLAGVSAAMQAKANALVAGQTGNEFDTENTAIGLQHAFEDLYQDQGYAAVEVDVAEIEPPIVSDQAVEIPFTVAITEGGVYKLGAIDYPADALVPRAEVQKVLSKYPAGSGRPLDLFLLAVRDAYHARGYLDCAVVSHPSFNEATHIVITASISLPARSIGWPRFSSTALPMPWPFGSRASGRWRPARRSTKATSQASRHSRKRKTRSLSKWMLTVITTYDVKADPATHQVNCIFHFAKAAQSGR